MLERILGSIEHAVLAVMIRFDLRGRSAARFALCGALVALIHVHGAFAQSYFIETIAGTGTEATSGDGGAATSASVHGPTGVWVDGSGNVYIAEYTGNTIRKIDATTGNITTIAGTGTVGFSGDGSAATSAALNAPYGVAVDGAGHVYIADSANHRIRKIDAGTSNISTIAGTGTPGSTNATPATSATLNSPLRVFVDGTDLYIVESSGHSVRKTDTSGSTITTIAGTGTASSTGDGGAATLATVNYPSGVAVDGSGNIYVSERIGYRIRKIDAGTGNISTIAGTGTASSTGDGGLATSATVNQPYGVDVDGAGNIYFAESGSGVVRKINTSGIITTIAGTGTGGFSGDGGAATSGQLANPEDVFVDVSGSIYIADYTNERVRRLTATLTISSTSPTAAFVSAPSTANVTATFSEAVTGGTAASFVVHSALSGQQAGAYSGNNSTTLTFNPTVDFFPGETVFSTLTTAVQTPGGISMA
ncbi:MAG: hypothetical protein HOK90_03885, partial [Gemmatimonadetes bacterium]|nr:hypothetical protein [Gemmatimonadota bacterium]